MAFKVKFYPQEKTVSAEKGSDLMILAHRAGIELDNACAGKGTCGKCKIKLISGNVTPLTREELKHLTAIEVADGVRLACQTAVSGDVDVEIVGKVAPTLRIVEEGYLPEFTFEPVVRKVPAKLESPSLSDNLADLERVERDLKIPFSHSVSLTALRSLPNILRDSHFEVTAVISEGRIVGLEGGNTEDLCYGVALDIGTTTVVASLVDLNAGKEIGVASVANSQRRFGLDVLSRIQFAQTVGGLVELNRAIVRDVNSLIGKLCDAHSMAKEHIYELDVAGNATMLHLFAGIPPHSIGVSPYVSSFQSDFSFTAQEIGVEISEFGRVLLLPSVSSYVGADITAGIVAAGIHKLDESALLIDIGTNGEIVLGSKKKMVACSCAAGPALEGMNISCGAVAVEGAIEKVCISDGSIEIKTIGEKSPIGLCGSGVIDVVAELLRSGVVDPTGRLLNRDEYIQKGGSRRLAQHLSANGEPKFLLTNGLHLREKEISISQKDIRQVQLAKGAIHSGILTLLKETSSSSNDISRVYIAGAFGQHLTLQSLFRLGLIPDELAEKVVFIGNSAKAGALLSVLSASKREEIRGLVGRIRYFELSNYPDYQKLFVEALAFPNGVSRTGTSAGGKDGPE